MGFAYVHTCRTQKGQGDSFFGAWPEARQLLLHHDIDRMQTVWILSDHHCERREPFEDGGNRGGRGPGLGKRCLHDSQDAHG